MRPEKRLAELDYYEGKWVAVLDGHVVAYADTSVALVPQVRAIGPLGVNAVVQYVRPPGASYIVGVG